MFLPDGPLGPLLNRLLRLRRLPLGLLADRLLGLRRLPLVSYRIRPTDVIQGTGGHLTDRACLLLLAAPGPLPGSLLFASPPDLLFAGARLFPKLLFVPSALHLLLAGMLFLTDPRLLCLLPLSLHLNGPLLLLALALPLPLRLSLSLDLALLLGLPLALGLSLLFGLSLSFLFLASALLLLLPGSLLGLPLLLGLSLLLGLALALLFLAGALLLILARTLLLFLPGSLFLLALLPVALLGLPALLVLLRLVLLVVGCLDVIKRTCGRRLGRHRWR